MREYELTIIIQPEISEEGAQGILAKLDEIIESQSAIRLLCDDSGKRKLAYEIRNFHKGHYYLLSFLDEGKVVSQLERVLRLEESVLRFLTVKVADRVTDIEGRRAAAKEREIELQKRAAEKAAREAEEAKARAESERLAAERLAAERVAAERLAAERVAADQAAAGEASSEDTGEAETTPDADEPEVESGEPPSSPPVEQAERGDSGDQAEEGEKS